MARDPEELDGRIGEGWSGVKPNGSHVNVVLARRGSVVHASALAMFSQPSPGQNPTRSTIGQRWRTVHWHGRCAGSSPTPLRDHWTPFMPWSTR